MAIPSLTAAVLTVSDGVAAGTREDRSGDALAARLEEAGYDVVARRTVADDAGGVADAVVELAAVARLVVSTGGTGFGPRDVTPEAVAGVLDRHAPGLVHLMLERGISHTPMAALSRPVAGSVGTSLAVTLPGSPKGAVENLDAILPVVPHALQLLGGDTEHGNAAR